VSKSVEGVNDADKFARTVQALDLLMVSRQDQECLFRLLTGILFLGQVCNDCIMTF
jgi:myosin heavy subunit